jgi:GTP cyclohydrolase II
MITKLAEVALETKYGVFTESLFGAGTKEVIGLQMGELSGQEAVLVRIHSQCITGHVFNGIECDCAIQMSFAQALIAAQGSGLIIWMDHEGKGNGHLAKMLSVPFKRSGLTQELAYEKAGYPRDNREYLLAAEMLTYFKIKSIRLITNNPKKQQALLQLGIKIKGLVHTPAVHDLSWGKRLEEGELSIDIKDQ